MDKRCMRTDREFEYDLMRVISLVGVIVIHVCAMQWRKLDLASGGWTILHIYDMLSKFSVPVFFMISGRFMLDPVRHCSVGKILRKIFHIVMVFLFWSAVYMILNIARMAHAGGHLRENKWVIVEFFIGEYHMWFLFTLAGLYLLTPLLRYIAASREMCGYYLVLFLVFGSLLGFMKKLPAVGGIVDEMSSKLMLDMAVGYSGYYVLGHWLRTEKLSNKTEKLLYLGGFLGAVFTVVGTWYASYVSGTADESLADYLAPNVVLTSAAVYHFVISHHNKLQPKKWITNLAEASFGCYLVHPLFLWIFEWVGLMPTLLHPLVMVPILTGITLAISVGTTVIMKKVPLLKNVVS